MWFSRWWILPNATLVSHLANLNDANDALSGYVREKGEIRKRFLTVRGEFSPSPSAGGSRFSDTVYAMAVS